MRDDESEARDPRTLVASSTAGDDIASLETMAQVYARVVQLVGLGAAHAEAPGYRLFWSTGGELAYADVRADRESYAVVGRHSQCDVRLDEDPRISLRHLLATSTVTAGGGVALHLMDLRAGFPFHLDDAEPRRAIDATGPVALRLGRYVVCAVPLGVRGGVFAGLNRGEAWPAYRIAPSADLAAPEPVSARPHRTTHITIRRATTHVEDLAGPSRPGWARMIVSREGRSAAVELSAEDLAAGVLVGRSDRCIDRGVAEVLSAQVSRAHVLLLEQHDRVEVFDLCSTNGTRQGGRSIRRATLADEGSVLHLGKRVRLELSRARLRGSPIR